MMQFLRWLVLSALVVAAHGQYNDDTRRAEIRGPGGNSGRCTIEVRVDIAAEVSINGDAGRLRTLAGTPATWNRLDCTGPLPNRMSDFRFRGIDGRGTVTLLQDPRNNNSVAVIRIDDQRGGSENYKFEIEWSGGSGGFSTGGRGPFTPNRGANRRLSAERAMDLCRAEVHERGEREYSLRDIDITSVGVDTNLGRRDWITGTFIEGASDSLRSNGYRFTCAMDYNLGRVRAVEIQRAER